MKNFFILLKQTAKVFLTKKSLAIFFLLVFLILGGFLFYNYKKTGKFVDKKTLFQKAVSAIDNISKILPIQADTKKELEAVDKLTQAFLKNDDQTRTYLVMLQNNLELRPGGGFLGQYAIIKIKNGEVVYQFVEDSNLLDQRIHADVPAPAPIKRMAGTSRWKFRDSNFSPDFPTNVEKAKYFYRLGGGKESNFDGVIAVNASVLNDVLKLTGPIEVPGYPGQYNSDNAVVQLETQVEQGFEQQGINVQNRKLILKKMTEIIIGKLMTLGNITKIADLGLSELRNKNVMLNFKDSELQELVGSVYWDGTVAADWQGDYLMLVDANLGALKSDYYMRREISYDLDMTAEKPIATVNIKYMHTATHGDWRTSDYHSYSRIYVPQGATVLERKMVSTPTPKDEFGKTSLGYTVHVLIGKETNAMIKYELPASVKENYKLLVQKQSGVGDVPVKVHIKTSEGEYNYDSVLKKDLKLQIQ